MKKVVAFIGLLGVIYALALQHGLFDRADAAAATPAPAPAPVAERDTVAAPQAAGKNATKRLHLKR